VGTGLAGNLAVDVDASGRVAPEEADRLACELCSILRRRDQLSLQAARLAGGLARDGYGERVAAVSTTDQVA
jgi:hypothetical protein